MDDSKWERWGNWGGILFVVLVVASIVISGSPPKLTDSTAKIAKYFGDHIDEVRWSGYLGALATIPILIWLGSVWRIMRRGEGGVPRLAVTAAAGLVFAGAMADAAGVVFNTIALRGVGGAGGAEGTRFFFFMSWIFNATGVIGIAVFVGAFSAVIVRSGILPKLLGWYGLLVALVGVVGSASMATTDDTLYTLTFVSLIGALIFVLAASILMLMRGTADRSEVDRVIVESAA